MKRRTFIAGLGSAAAWPLAARAQQQVLPVVGFLIPQSADEVYKNMTVPFLQGLKEAGYVEGQNVTVEYRYAENQFGRLPALATDLVRRRVAAMSDFPSVRAGSRRSHTDAAPSRHFPLERCRCMASGSRRRG
jgi:putative tryptophan/tyrosine transport system substrate-binding protein